ncbi:MAG: preprotein translocase subunit SecG [Bacteroidetes bacterium]|nr:MAG: preprotein translocase subunit SecG [Bacteroidota bacterium]PTM12659.1 MAG: preprotein translocase subunit SecG [Bacteroidota bacterium]
MITGLTILTALVCLLLMGAVLIQNPKGGGIDSTFGGSQANQMFGASKQTDFIEKITWYLAIALFVLCIITSMVVDSAADAGSLIPQ